MKRDEENLEAVNATIELWKENLAKFEQGTLSKDDIGLDKCPLCELTKNKRKDNYCYSCPLAQYDDEYGDMPNKCDEETSLWYGVFSAFTTDTNRLKRRIEHFIAELEEIALYIIDDIEREKEMRT